MKPQNSSGPTSQAADDEIVASAANAAKAFVDDAPQGQKKEVAPTPSSITQSAQSIQPAATEISSPVPAPVIQPLQKNAVFATFDTHAASTNSTTPNHPHAPEPVSFSQMSKKKNHLMIPILLVLFILLICGLGAGFYYGYWTTAETVYSRFQKSLSSITSESISANTETITAYDYDLKVDANQNSENILNVSSNGAVNESGFDTLSDITYKGSDINIAGKFIIKDEESPYTLYFKLKGISHFLSSSGIGDSLGTQYSSVLSEYDDQWVRVSLPESLYEDMSEKSETLSKENYKELWTVIEPIVTKKLIGTNSDSGVFHVSNPRTENIAKLSTWAYDLTLDELKFNDAIDEIIQAVDTTSLSDAQKKEVKNTFESTKIKEKESYSTDYVQDEVFTIWVEKNTAKIVRAKQSRELKYKEETISKSVIDVSITSFTLEVIDAEVKFSSGINPDDMKELTSKIKFNNSSKMITLEGNYGTKKDGYTYILNLKPTSSNDSISKPESSIDYKTIFEKLNNNN